MSGKTKFILIFSERLWVGELARECKQPNFLETSKRIRLTSK